MGVEFCKTGIINASGEDVNNNQLLYVPRSYNPTSYIAYQFNMTENLVTNQTYTIQLWDVDVSHAGKSAENLGVDVYWGGGMLRMIYWHGTSYFTNGHADYLKGTFTVTSAQSTGSGSANLWLNIYNSVGYVADTMNMKIGAWKLEKGSIPTPWTMNENDWGFVGNDHGFIERFKGEHPMSVYEGHYEMDEIIEY